jgi:very-short-patch-repair endonuclease
MVYIYYDGPKRITKARELRRTQTKAEKILWDRVRNRKLGGFKIRRQHILNETILDFYCTEKRLCIEVDGPYHNEPIVKGLDMQRDEELEAHGFTVVRFTNDQVILELETVLVVILQTLQNLPSDDHSPLNQKEIGNYQPV